jgi:ubiquinol-cytochrome c reductase cytochrome b subunit
MPHWLRRVGNWFEDRLGLAQTLWPVARHPVPRGLGWWYVFGSATLTMFILQLVTGTCLTLVYVPSTAGAHDSLLALNYDTFWGWLLRALHFFGASGMVVLLILHMTRVFLFGAYKYPRELTWLVGVALLVLTLGMAFTGQVLRWDEDAYWGLGIGVSMMGRFPVIGPGLVQLVLGGPVIGGDTLSRFFTLHVFWLPGLLIFFLVVHLYLVVRQGISARPVPGQVVDPATEQVRYDEKLKQGEPFFPDDFMKDLIFSSVVIFIILVLSICVGPMGPSAPADPTRVHAEPRPDWEFRWLFALLALSPPQIETFLMLALPPLGILILILVPFVSNKGERSARRRPVAVLVVLMLYLTFGILTWMGYQANWSPKMFAWSEDPVPEHLLKGSTPRQLQGAAVFQNKSCRNCHAIDGAGGRRGPDLTLVATRLTHEELIRQVLQGGGNMPAYGKQLSAAEVETLVAFLETLRPRGEKPAQGTAPPLTNP